VRLLRPTKSRPYFVLRWKDEDGSEHQRSTKCKSETMARERAADLSRQLDLLDVGGNGLSWVVFCVRYEEEHLAGGSPKTLESWQIARDWFTELMRPQFLDEITSSMLSRFRGRLRQALLHKNGRAPESTLSSYMRQLQAGLNWAADMGMVAERFTIRSPRRVKGRKARARPVREQEFHRMIAAVPQVRPRDPGLWQRYLWGLWLSGLRREESLIVSWDADAPFAMDLSGKYPRFRIWGESQKSRRDELLPLTPDFAEWVLQTPPDDRVGRLFPMDTLYTGTPFTPRAVGRIVSDLGRAAKVWVNAKRKPASCHDLRRAFGTRWAPKVRPAVLQKLMRHASIETTMGYYVDLDTDDLAADLWKITGAQGDGLGDGSESAENREFWRES
jgi:integrase